MSVADFDIASHTYDETFVDSSIGKYQRDKVWAYMDQYLNVQNHLKILELNCGTGADAIYMAQKGHSVTATDMSEGMLQKTLDKASASGFFNQIQVQKADLNFLERDVFGQDYDLVFSNFGGLNCISPESMERLAKQLPRLLRQNGRFIAVIMPTFCPMETLYFLLKFKPKAAFRRQTRSFTYANVDGVQVKTWYYSPQSVAKTFKTHFQVSKAVPVGFFLPPSYLESFFKDKKRLLNFLNNREKKTASGWLAPFADHYLIELELR